MKGRQVRAKSAAKAWLLAILMAGAIYLLIWGIIGSSSLEYEDIYVYDHFTSFWEPVPIVIGLLFLIILGLPLFISNEKRASKLASVAGCWAFYLPVLRGSLLPSIAGMVVEMLQPFGAGSFVYTLCEPLAAARGREAADWIRWGSVDSHFVAAQALIAVGLAITIVGFVQVLRARTEKRLVTQGLYATVRHPQHLGIALFTLGVALAVARTAGFMAWFTITYFYVLLAMREERQLAEQFGEGYQSYRKNTPFVIPFIQTGLRLPGEGWKRIGMLIGFYLLGLTIVCITLDLFGVEVIRTL